MSDAAPSPFDTLDRVRARATEAVLGQSGLAHVALAAEIRRRFGSSDVDLGALVRDATIEAAFPYVQSSQTLASLSGSLLRADVVDALTRLSEGRRYAFPRDLHPYAHQEKAWRLLADPIPNSVLVSSGTGSGKTECFLVPILNDLAREAAASGPLVGVRAIALYPLNALIASQQERLREWTAPFDGKIRFGLYNGAMPDDLKVVRPAPREQVLDRRMLRASPPPILVTNVTMLEYMTVRREDRPVVETSRGRLRWIVLDEAHSYVGSAAAEIALLIRRVLVAFGVEPEQVRFVATSATIGGDADVGGALVDFLRDISGAAAGRAHVVMGERRFPALGTPAAAIRLNRNDLVSRDVVASNPAVQSIIKRLREGAMSSLDLARMAEPTGVDGRTLALALTQAAHGAEPLVPLRVHGFMRAVPGIWSCLDPACPDRPAGWPFGGIAPERVEACPCCGSAVLEIVTCSGCGEPYLEAVEQEGRLRLVRRPVDRDEFAAGLEADGAEEDVEESNVEASSVERSPEIQRLFSTRPLDKSRLLHVEVATGLVCDVATPVSRVLHVHDRLVPDCCPACDATAAEGSKYGSLLRPFRYGAPFLIGAAAPIVLDGVDAPPIDPSGEGPARPFGGRQLLSFTDSRQSTARFAASLQGASERAYVRSLAYHAVQDSMREPAGAGERRAKLDQTIEALASVGSNPAIAPLLHDARRERAELDAPRLEGVAWRTLVEDLARRDAVAEWMPRVWGERDPRFENGGTRLAELLLLREFARRPKYDNQAETMGLARLRFAAVDAITERHLPLPFAERGLTLADWRDFLYALLTSTVRARFAVVMDFDDARWLSSKFRPKILFAPGPPREGSGVRWPSAAPASRRAIIVRLLARGLNVDVASAEGRRVAEDVLQAAWEALAPLLSRPGSGDQYALDLRQAHIAPMVTAYRCPVTRRLLDRTFRGMSPYGLDRTSRSSDQPCEQVAMPRHPNPFLLEARGGGAIIEHWLRADPAVAGLRARGLWTDLHDRIALFSPYVRAAEHSAQQPPSRLRRYEEEFKKGEINILNCSTTMEMGVDIGSVSAVMMTNVPPSIANYRQRVGRAGRRGQGLATALTYARDTPLDRETFRDPVAYLRRRIEAPRVSLDSRRIVLRHANALLLSAWFKQAGGEAMRAQAGPFFGCLAAIGATRTAEHPSARFQEWVASAAAASTRGDLEVLVRGSAVSADENLLGLAAAAMRSADMTFAAEWSAIQSQAAALDRDAARKSLGLQLERMCKQYLLSELADRGFLPGHGFPTAVVQFVNHDETGKGQPAHNAAPDGNRFQKNEFPSRNLDVAIREYAPGAEVVLDGLVYRSAGVTLNWKRPAGESDVAEVQSLRWFWNCRACGAAGASGGSRPDTCSACHAALGSGEVVRYLRPSGFTIDFSKKPHAEIERVDYVEPEPETVSAKGADWRAIEAGIDGRIRTTHEGIVFHSSAGAWKAGYSVCLECGRAEAEGAPPVKGVAAFATHRPLRYTKASDDGRCPGPKRGFAVQTGLRLGHAVETDVAEVMPSRLESQRGAWALGSALRHALARRLGVDWSEMGISVVAGKTAIGSATHSVLLFDRASGGAGFATRLSERLEEVLVDAKRILDCPQPGCVRACSACVLTSDLYAQADMLDRKKALAFLEAEAGSARA